MKPTMLAILALALLPIAALGQEPAAKQVQVEVNPVSNAMRSMLARESKLIVAAAEEMPADKYDYHPTPAQMTFAHLIAHLAQSNNFLCSKISGASPPADPKLIDTDAKDKLVSALKASFDYCGQVLASVDDSKLGEQITMFGTRTSSQAGAMFTLANDFFDHYSTQAMYLRMNGLLPPSAQPPSGAVPPKP
jgi:uncharacterized damage-inducible protein DinB